MFLYMGHYCNLRKRQTQWWQFCGNIHVLQSLTSNLFTLCLCSVCFFFDFVSFFFLSSAWTMSLGICFGASWIHQKQFIYIYVIFGTWEYIKNVCIVRTSNSIFLFLFTLVSIMASSWISLVEELFFLFGGIISCFDDLFLAISICICCGGETFDFTKRPYEYATTCDTLVRNMKAQTSFQWQSKLNTQHNWTCFPHSVTQLNNIYIFLKTHFNFGKTCSWRDPQQAWRVNPEVMHAGGDWLDEFPVLWSANRFDALPTIIALPTQGI